MIFIIVHRTPIMMCNNIISKFYKQNYFMKWQKVMLSLHDNSWSWKEITSKKLKTQNMKRTDYDAPCQPSVIEKVNASLCIYINLIDIVAEGRSGRRSEEEAIPRRARRKETIINFSFIVVWQNEIREIWWSSERLHKPSLLCMLLKSCHLIPGYGRSW